jgi:hypothetical protein
MISIFIGILIIFIIITLIHSFKYSKKKYTISYPYGSGTWYDYTDTFDIRGNVIYYIDERGNSVVRSGTYGVKKNIR